MNEIFLVDRAAQKRVGKQDVSVSERWNIYRNDLIAIFKWYNIVTLTLSAIKLFVY